MRQSILLTTLLLWAMSCTSLLGDDFKKGDGDDGEDSDGDTGEGDGSGDSTCDEATCSECVGEAYNGNACYAQALECSQSESCAAIQDCFQYCPEWAYSCVDDDSCYQSCVAQHPDGRSLAVALAACFYCTECDSVCNYCARTQEL